MSTDTSGLPAIRYVVVQDQEYQWSLLSRFAWHRDDAEDESDRYTRAAVPNTFAAELVRVAEADLLRKLVAAALQECEPRWDRQREATHEIREALDALLAVAPHWGES